MAKKPDKRKPDDPEQSLRFEETARDVEAVDDDEALEQFLKKAARGGSQEQQDKGT